MVEIQIPDTIPDCILKRILKGKVGQRNDISSNVYDKLGEFCRKVSAEVSQINLLFPEYTPHDKEYHLKRLFHVADTVLGRERFEAMNSTELFLLAVSLYGHDWGMSVSQEEKEYITTGSVLEDKSSDDLWVLSDERSRFAKFARDKQLVPDGKGRVEDISIELWRDYVRETHAFRSAERVRRFFEAIDGGVADAASRVCEGHWLDFEYLQDYDSYPPNFSVMRETVNLRALAVYLRLIDLLDLAEDRTPYVIWKFVAPKDPRSKMEWAKHRALRPVTCPPYQNGRVIRVDGSTDDHEVYAALEDLRIYCEDQLRGCNDVLAQMNDSNHKLDLYHIEWRVAARGFKKTSIRFEFDRDQMFQILSDEIYQGDPYVFIRELLQNSIDAIRMRRNIIQKYRGYEPINLGVIRANVEHQKDGDAIVTWTDDGIGMDEYVVKNYLAVAGKSYYQSEEFEREGLEMDPISRFGIGILSCFMVANRIEIDTYKDPILPPQSEPLKIKIPDPRRQFRIETLPHVAADKVGTTVRVFVEGTKIPDVDKNSKSVKSLNVTEYLSIVAGFVEFPIVITEGDQKTIILHPGQDANAIRRRFGGGFKVHQLDLSYPWFEATVPQDLHNARELLREERFDVASDLGLEEYEGVLIYAVPIRDDVDIDSGEVRVLGRKSGQRVRSGDGRKTIGLSRSSFTHINKRIFKDGILLPAGNRYMFRPLYIQKGILYPKLVVNLNKKHASRIDLSRTRLLYTEMDWSEQINTARIDRLFDSLSSELLSIEPQKRFYQMARICLYHGITPSKLWEIFPHDRWVVPFLGAGGQFNFLDLCDVNTDKIYSFPEPFRNLMGHIIFRLSREDRYTPFSQWAGERILINFPTRSYSDLGDIASDLAKIPFMRSHRYASIRFLQPPWVGSPPLIQKVLSPVEISEEKPDFKGILEKAINDPISLNPVERDIFIHSTITPYFAEFPQAFDRYFAYGWKLLNLKNPIVQTFIRIVAAVTQCKIMDTMSADKIGYFEDLLSSTRRGTLWFESDVDKLSENLKAILCTAGEMELINPGNFEDTIPTSKDFVPGSLSSMYHEISLKSLSSNKKIRPFGMPI